MFDLGPIYCPKNSEEDFKDTSEGAKVNGTGLPPTSPVSNRITTNPSRTESYKINDTEATKRLKRSLIEISKSMKNDAKGHRYKEHKKHRGKTQSPSFDMPIYSQLRKSLEHSVFNKIPKIFEQDQKNKSHFYKNP